MRHKRSVSSFCTSTFLVLSVSLLASSLRAAHTKAPLDDTAAKSMVAAIQLQLPAGWQTSYDSDHHFLEIARLKPALMSQTFPGMPAGEPVATLDTFSLAFRVMPYIAPSEFHRLKARNAEIDKQLALLRFALTGDKAIKGDYFQPQTLVKARLVEEYERLKKSRHHLPDFHFRNVSLAWIWGLQGMGGGYYHIEEEPIRQECEAVTHKITQLFTAYPQESATQIFKGTKQRPGNAS